MLVRSPLLTSHKWRELVSSGRLVSKCHGVFSLVLRLFKKNNQNAPRPSEHPPVMEKKMSKRLGGIKGCKYKTSSWHLNIFCFASFFRLYAFVEAAALRSIVLRYAGVPITTRVSFFYFFPFFLFIWRCRFFRVFFPLSLCMESTSYVLSFRMVFFLPCDHGLDFLHQLV